jgi:phosphate-selective porin OprO/OprP
MTMKHMLALILGATLVLAAAAPVVAGVSETDALIQLLLQKGLITAEEAANLRAELAVQKQEEKDKQKEFQVTSSKPLRLAGYTQVRYRNDDTINDTFDIRRARIDLRGALGGGFDYRLQAELAGSSAKLLDATVGWRMNDAFKATAGQLKIPFSQENLASSNRLETINRSQVVEALVARGKDVIGNHNGRDIGVQAAGSFSLFKQQGFLDYAVGVFDGSGINTADTNEKKDLVGRLIVHPFKGLSVGGSFYTGRYTLSSAPTREDSRQRVGGELAYVNGPFLLKGEVIHGYDARVEKSGWYALGGYFVVAERLQAIVKYDTFDPDASRFKNETSITTLGCNWFFNKWAFLQLNYEVKDETGPEVSNNALTSQLTVQF